MRTDTMKKIAAFLALLLALTTPTFAQTGSQKTVTQLNTEVNSQFADQVIGAITPFVMRQMLLDLVASSSNPTGDVFFGSGLPWCDVRSKGALGDGSTDDTAAFQACVTVVEAFGVSGTIYVPTSANGQYCIKTGPVTLSAAYTAIVGENRGVTLSSCGTDNSVLALNNSLQTARNLTLVGKGRSTDTFSATTSTLVLGANCIDCYIEHLSINNGLHAVQWNSGEARALDIIATNSYGSAVVYFNGLGGGVAAGWLQNIKPDQNEFPSGDIPAAGTTYAAWQNAHVYTKGTVVSVTCQDAKSYYFQATLAGTSGAAFPACKNYAQNIVDNTVTWRLSRPNPYYHYQLDTGTAEIFLHDSDTGGGDAGVAMTNTLAGTAPGLFRGVNLNGSTGYLANYLGTDGNDFHLVGGGANGGCISPGCGNFVFKTNFTGNVKVVGGNCTGSPYCAVINTGSGYIFNDLIVSDLTSGIAQITGTVDHVAIEAVATNGVATFTNTSSGTNIRLQVKDLPRTVANGGTGVATNTAHGVVLGQGTSPVTTVGPCTTGQIVVGVTGADPICGSMRQMIGSGTSGTLPQNTTAYAGLQTAFNATNQLNAVTVALAGTLKNMVFNAGTTPAAGQTITVTLMTGTYTSAVAGTLTASGVTCTISNPAVQCTDNVNSVAIAANAVFAWRVVTSATTGTITGGSWAVEFDNP